MTGDEQLVVPLNSTSVLPQSKRTASITAPQAANGTVVRRFLWSALALAPAALAPDTSCTSDARRSSCSPAIALIPLAWLIGEATEHAAEHTGPGIGGFLNASFGNAPELIIALLAIADGLPDVVRGTITGSVVSNILLVLGVAMIAGGEGKVDRAIAALAAGGCRDRRRAAPRHVGPGLARLGQPALARRRRRSRSQSRCLLSTSGSP